MRTTLSFAAVAAVLVVMSICSTPGAEAAEGSDHVARPLGLELEELAVVTDLLQVERDVHRRVHAGGRVEGASEEAVFVRGVAVDRVRRSHQ